jgi:hypothetical protein
VLPAGCWTTASGRSLRLKGRSARSSLVYLIAEITRRRETFGCNYGI